ncbi:oleate hydratase [Edaphobacter paludis]|uniref:Oleate hydratase n=1 Tax=Edaphobacter paludis TaxID=3035702 RepID=A0AAU7DEP7_9BACT
MLQNSADKNSLIYLVGGGIASLAAAAFLIRDGDVRGGNIIVFEEAEKIGGSLDAAGTSRNGYVIRGGRMIESKYLCTYDLFSSIPTLDDSKTVTEEIFEWNRAMKISSKSRLFREGHRINAPKFGLSEGHILAIERLELQPEMILGRTSISDHFEPSFFETDFWIMWCSTFAFQPWHSAVEFKRYLLRFTHLVSGFNTLGGIMRTPYNQYDSMIRPLQRWLEAHGVRFEYATCVTDLGFCHDAEGYRVDRITCQCEGRKQQILIKGKDSVIVTLGSMTESSSLGSMDLAPVLKNKAREGSWALWEKIADGHPQFGCPATFADHIDQSKWISFTTTLYDPTFFRLVKDMTGNIPGEGGLVTFPDSNWLASIVIPQQPHFIGQPTDTQVFWGYGLFVDKPGNFVKKPMSSCTGREIMTEIMGHLRIESDAQQILGKCICIPCMMPFITSQFLCRAKGDRPQVVPKRSKNLAFVGQFCELPDDVVFTIEYSIRSAQTAVYALLGLPRDPPPVYKGYHDPRILFKAFFALHDRQEGP